MEDSRIYDSTKLVLSRTGTLLTVSGLLLAVGVLKGSIVDPGFHPYVYSSCIYSGLALAALVPLAWITNGITAFVLRDTSYPVRCLRRTELEELLPLYDELIGGDHPSINEVKEIINANKEIIRVIERRTKTALRTSSTIVGFCSVLPITKAAADLLEQERLTGMQMNREHVCTPKQIPYALYIGSIGAKGIAAKARMLGYLLGVIDDQARHNVRVVYTRPVSRDGLRLAKQHDFQPVAQGVSPTELRRIYKLTIPADDGEFVPSRSQRRKAKAARIAVAVAP